VQAPLRHGARGTSGVWVCVGGCGALAVGRGCRSVRCACGAVRWCAASCCALRLWRCGRCGALLLLWRGVFLGGGPAASRHTAWQLCACAGPGGGAPACAVPTADAETAPGSRRHAAMTCSQAHHARTHIAAHMLAHGASLLTGARARARGCRHQHRGRRGAGPGGGAQVVEAKSSRRDGGTAGCGQKEVQDDASWVASRKESLRAGSVELIMQDEPPGNGRAGSPVSVFHLDYVDQ
jgi:hypothetical protein